MPVSVRTSQADLGKLLAYTDHGVDLTRRGSHAVGQCPFCGRDGKFSVDVATGLWRCFVCAEGTEKGGGNPLVFLRKVYEASQKALKWSFAELVAADRKLLRKETIADWGVCKSALNGGSWLVPGFGVDGKLDQLYKRVWVQDSWRLLPTQGVWPAGRVHQLHLPPQDYSADRKLVIICEGPWDGMALWEVARSNNTNIVAVPGCNVWRDEWTELCRGKEVWLLFDSDHPRHYGGKTFRAGYDGMVRVAKKLSGVAESVKWLKWGPDGYDPDKPSGWDVRDYLAAARDRRVALGELLTKLQPAQPDWFVAPGLNGTAHRSAEAQECTSWAACEAAWRDAMQWRQDLSDLTAVSLAVSASTQQAGNQLFLDLVGSPGSGKTTICRGLLTSHHCVHVENVTKLISGYKVAGDAGKDCSFIARANGKTWVTCEFDTVLKSPQYVELMSKIRRIFDGETASVYGNSDEDRVYAALRTPWIRAGTFKMMDHDQSQLGDRFLRFIIEDPMEVEKRSILKRALRAERSALVETANGTAGSIVDPKLRTAHALMGGYVDWLRASVEDLLPLVEVSEVVEDRCIDLAELSADLRARPNEDKRVIGGHDVKELPTRLARQNIRLATFLAVTLNKRSVDKDVMRIVSRVALNTAHGHSLDIVKWLCSANPRAGGRSYHDCGGIDFQQLAVWCQMTPERMHNYLMFLKRIEVLEWKEVPRTHGFWMLTRRVHDLYLRVMGD